MFIIAREIHIYCSMARFDKSFLMAVIAPNFIGQPPQELHWCFSTHRIEII
jgi:hypothetical protein